MSRALTTSSTVICPLGSDAYPHGYRVLGSDREASRPRLHPRVWIAPRPLCRAHQVREYLRIVLVRISNSHLCLRGGLTVAFSRAAKRSGAASGASACWAHFFKIHLFLQLLLSSRSPKRKTSQRAGIKCPSQRARKFLFVGGAMLCF